MKDQERWRAVQVCLACGLAGLLLVGASECRADTVKLRVQTTSAKKLNQAVALLARGQIQQADKLLQQVEETEPGYLTAQLGRAQLAVSAHQLDDADRMVTGVLQRQQRLPEAHNMKGLLLLLRKDRDGARREFARAIELQPRYVTPRVYLAVLDRVNGDYAGAANEYKALIDVAPHFSTGYLGEAEALIMLHRENEALQVLESWKSADPKTVMPYQVLANVYLADHKPQPAMQQLKAATAKNPHDPATLALLGDAYEAMGDTRSAASQYQAALTLNHSSVEALLGLGGIEAGTGQADKAVAHFRQVLIVDPTNAVACNDVAWLLASQGKNLDEALRLAQGTVQRDPQYADARDTLGWVRYKRGEYPQALVALKEAKAMAPGNPEVAAHLGLTYAKTGDRKDALAELRRALSAGSPVSNRSELERVAGELSSEPAQVSRR